MKITVRQYKQEDLDDLIRIWNEVVEEGVAFPQEDYLDRQSGADFFASQTYTAAAEVDGRVLGLYILHPNNVGRCGHICNASYAVSSEARGLGIGEKLVRDCLIKGKEFHFRQAAVFLRIDFTCTGVHIDTCRFKQRGFRY